MTSYRRLRIRGGTYFFSVMLARAGSTDLLDHVDDLRAAYAATFLERPFRTDAIVVLPDHLHAVWTLPEGDDDFSTRWRLIKARFTRRMDVPRRGSPSVDGKRERGLWQRRFWEHAIRDEADYLRHVRYCWFNPVMHGLKDRPEEWPWSSVHREIARGRTIPEISPLAFVGKFGERRRMGAQHPSYLSVARDQAVGLSSSR